MSNYKVVRNANGKVTHWGINDDNFVPKVPEGSILTIEENPPEIINTPSPYSLRVKELPSWEAFIIAYLEDDTALLDKFKADWVKTKQKHPI